MIDEAGRDELERRFVASLDEIAADLLRGLDIRHSRKEPHLSSPLTRWLDFRLRFVDPRPRRVHVSRRCARSLPGEASRGFERFVRDVERGADINAHQGKGLFEFHDTSAAKKRNRTDLLWADWGLLHFHLTDKPLDEGKRFVERSDWLLFALFLRDDAILIDVRSHKEPFVFQDEELVATVVEEWPELADRWEMKGILPGEPWTASEVKSLRESGMTTTVALNGKVYQPSGSGLSTAATSVRVSMTQSHVEWSARRIAALAFDPEGPIRSEMTADERANAALTLALSVRGLSVYDSSAKKHWLLSRPPDAERRSAIGALYEHLAPEWLLAALDAAERRQE